MGRNWLCGSKHISQLYAKQANVAANVMGWSWLELDWWRLFVTGCQPSPLDDDQRLVLHFNCSAMKRLYVPWKIHQNCAANFTSRMTHKLQTPRNDHSFCFGCNICRREICTRKKCRWELMRWVCKWKRNIKLITMASQCNIHKLAKFEHRPKPESVNCNSHSTRTIKSKLWISQYYIIFGESDSAFASSQNRTMHRLDEVGAQIIFIMSCILHTLEIRATLYALAFSLHRRNATWNIIDNIQWHLLKFSLLIVVWTVFMMLHV